MYYSLIEGAVVMGRIFVLSHSPRELDIRDACVVGTPRPLGDKFHDRGVNGSFFETIEWIIDPTSLSSGNGA